MASCVQCGLILGDSEGFWRRAYDELQHFCSLGCVIQYRKEGKGKYPMVVVKNSMILYKEIEEILSTLEQDLKDWRPLDEQDAEDMSDKADAEAEEMHLDIAEYRKKMRRRNHDID